MGQRFQVICNYPTYSDKTPQLQIYHSQWLWGDYVIRRIGTAIRNMLKDKNYHTFEQFLYGSFFGKPKDMNSISRYFQDSNKYHYDNNEFFTKGAKTSKSKKVDFTKILSYLDNNDGFMYLEFDENQKIKGYSIIYENNDNEYETITAEQYTKKYGKEIRQRKRIQ
jgi:hypothetical protein